MSEVENVEIIYHLSPLTELRAGVGPETYSPGRFADDGFVHCTTHPETVLAVAGDYFADLTEPLVVLALLVERLSARVAIEAPAPIDGGGSSHLEGGERFPHVYGAIELAAVSGAAVLEKSAEAFVWPEEFASLDRFWNAHPPDS